MLTFQQKVNELKRLEAAVYTTCLALSNHSEDEACEAAKQALLMLFSHESFWKMDEHRQQSCIRRHCLSICLSRGKRRLNDLLSSCGT